MPGKKKKKQDFQKVKLKVGRKLPRPANETRTQFKVRGIDIKSQFHSDKTAVEAGGVEPSAANIKVCSAIYFVNIYSVCIFCHHWLIIDTARSRVCITVWCPSICLSICPSICLCSICLQQQCEAGLLLWTWWTGDVERSCQGAAAAQHTVTWHSAANASSFMFAGKGHR